MVPLGYQMGADQEAQHGCQSGLNQHLSGVIVALTKV